MEELKNQLEIEGETPAREKLSKKSKIIVYILMFIIISLIITSFILLKYIIDNEDDDEDDENVDENENNLEKLLNETTTYLSYNGIKISNISYSQKGIIKNTFKKNGVNYEKDIGNVNSGKDYNRNIKNYYDLYIPYSATKNKDEYNEIILFLHGGAWTYGEKERMDFLCQTFFELGYITATMSYSLLNDSYAEKNIFRLIDEISSTINNIKLRLKKEGFNENKLELAIGGTSAGAHLSLLYTYKIKKTPIPIKFVINISGPVTMETEHFLVPKDNNLLENIEPEDITKAKEENKLEKVTVEFEKYLLSIMNLFTGEKYKNEEVTNMYNDKEKKIDENNEKYKEMLNIIKYAFPVNYVEKNSLPTLCIYGGNDTVVGIEHYAYLKKKFNENNNNNINLVYSKTAGHSRSGIFGKKDEIDMIKEIIFQFLNFSKTYFTSNPYLN